MRTQEEIYYTVATMLVGVARQEVNGFVAAENILKYLHSQGVFIAKHGFYSDLMEPLIEENDG